MALITYLTTIQFDFGAIACLESELPRLGIRRPLVVTDRGVIAAGLLERVRAALPGNMPAAVYDGTPENPTERAVLDALALYRAEGCDGLIALGGGSAMDLAKAVGVLARHPEPLSRYMAVLGGGPRITPDVAPVVAIPTTAGTGSEVGRGAVIILEDGRKLAMLSPNLLPKLAICDPELTLGLPPILTAGTGMDAIAHCIETFLAPAINPPAEAIALDGLERALAHIERAVRDGEDREARWHMMMAAMEGAMAFQKGLGAVHALSHPLGGLPGHRLHHGTLNAIFLPAVLRFNQPAAGEAKYARLRRAMGLGEAADVADFIEGLVSRLGLPTRLRAMGVPREALPEIAAAALLDHCHLTNPRQASEADYRAILEEAWA